MSGVVKAIVGTAIAVVGIVTGNPLLIAQGASMAIGAVLSRSPKSNAASNQRLSKQLIPEDFRKIAFGRTAGATDLRFWEVHGAKNTDYSEVIAVAGHRIHSFQEFYAEEEVVSFSGTNATGTYANVLQRSTNNGAPGNAALSVGSGAYWTSNSKFTGTAHYALHWTYDEKKLPNGIPQKVLQVIEGALVYDPRKDSTRGGAGTHRVDDQSTWSYATTDSNGQPIGRNNALQALWYLIGWRVQNPTTSEWILVAGQGVDPIDIDFASFIAAANDAEAQQFYTDMLLSTGDSHSTNRAIICCNDTIGRFLDPGGLWTYKVTKDDTAAPAVALTEDDILVGPVEWIPSKPLSEQYNRVVGTYVDPSSTSLYQPKSYQQVKDTSYETADGFKKRKTLNYQAIQSDALAQKASRIVLNESRFQGEFKATFNFKALQAQCWDVVGLTLDRYGFTSGTRFRVKSQSLTATGIEMVLRITHASIYAAGTVVTPPAPSTLAKYDPRQQIPVEGLAVAPATLTGANGTAQDAVSVSWTVAPGNVRRTEGQFKLTAAATWTTAFSSQADLNAVVAGPLMPSSAYQVRVRHVSIHEVPGAWSTVSVTTGANGRVNSAQVTYADGTSIEVLKPAEAGANVTAAHTAAAIAGQGAGATANNLAQLNATDDLNLSNALLAGGYPSKNVNANFVKWTVASSAPDGWVNGYGLSSWATRVSASSGYVYDVTIPASSNHELQQNMPDSVGQGYFTLEVEVEFVSGNWHGGGVRFYWYTSGFASNLGLVLIDFEYDQDINGNVLGATPTPGRYFFKKTFYISHPTAKDAFIGFSGAGLLAAPPNVATRVKGYLCSIRPATDGEIVGLTLRPAEAGANVTETRTSAAITGQGPGATASAAQVLNSYIASAGQNLIHNSSFRRGTSQWGLAYAGGSPSGATTLSITGGGKLKVDQPNCQIWAIGSISPFDNSTIRSGRHIFRAVPGMRVAWRAKGTVAGVCTSVVPYFRLLNQAADTELTGSAWGNAVTFTDLPGAVDATNTTGGGYWDVPSTAGGYWFEVEIYGNATGTGAGSFELEYFQITIIPANQTVAPAAVEGPPGEYLADVTATSQVTYELAPDKTVAADYLGVVNSTALAALVWSPKVFKGGSTIKTQNNTTYSLSGAVGGTFAVDNTNGSSTKGDVTISAMSANSATADLSILVDGILKGKITISVTKDVAPPPSSGGSGAKTASWALGEMQNISGTSFIALVSPIKTVTVASGEKIYAALNYDYIVSGIGAVSRRLEVKAQYSVTGANSWTDFGAQVNGTYGTSGGTGGAPDYEYSDPAPGTVNLSQNVTPPSAGTYDVRYVAKVDVSTRTLSPSTLAVAIMESKV